MRTAEAAQACIHLLKRENLGQATFVILDKIQHLSGRIHGWASSTASADGPRLFDFLDIPKSEHRVALYHALGNTLVAENLEDARRMAFKPSRKNRVVTMSGEVIEDSGAMSGGGKAPSRYRLGSGKGGNAFEADPRALQKATEQLEVVAQEQQDLQAELAQLKEERLAASRHEEKIEIDLRKAEMDVSSLRTRVTNIMQRSLPELRKAVAAAEREYSGSGGKGIKQLEKKISEAEHLLDSANRACEGIQSEISQLQDDIVAAGGERLQSAKEKLENAREQLSVEKSNASKATSRAKEAEKAIEKAKKAQETLAAEIEANVQAREEAKEKSERMVDDAAKVMETFNEAKKLHDEWSASLVEVQTEFSELKESLKNLRRRRNHFS